MKNLLKKQLNYDEFGNEIRKTITDSKGEKSISTHTYKYDKNNNIIEVVVDSPISKRTSMYEYF